MGVQLDVASREGFKEAADKVEAEFGPVCLLFNNAGINLFQTIEDISYDDWDWVLGVNLYGVINGVMTFAPRMKERALRARSRAGTSPTPPHGHLHRRRRAGHLQHRQIRRARAELFAAPLDVRIRHRRLGGASRGW